MLTRVLVCSLSCQLLLACGSSSRKADEPAQSLGVEGVAVLEARSGSGVTGEARFLDRGDSVEVTVNVAGATPGRHGVHVHEIGDCSAPDAKSAGDHFNPAGHQHGAPGVAEHHAGDLGNIDVAEDGTGTMTIVMPGVTLTPGAMSYADRALVVHANEDDFETQPSGDAGDRVACGVIRVEQKQAE